MKKQLILIILFPVAICSFMSCSDFAELIASSPCVGNDDAEICIQGERAGSLPGTSNVHCCENHIFRASDAKPCALSADAQTEIAGEFTSALNINESTNINIDVRTIEYGAFHKKTVPHCTNHDDECNDELIGRQFKVIGKIEISADLSGKINVIKLLLKELGLDAAQVEQATGQIGGQTKTVLASKGVMASICEERDHDICPLADLDPKEMVEVTERSEAQLESLIRQILGIGQWF